MTDVLPAIGFSITVQIDDKRAIVAQTHVAQDATSDEMNGVLDRVTTAINRQKAINDLVEWKRKLDYDELKLKELTGDLARIDEQHRSAWDAGGKRGAYKLNTKEEADRRNAESTRERYVMEIERDKQGIVECEEKIGLRNVA